MLGRRRNAAGSGGGIYTKDRALIPKQAEAVEDGWKGFRLSEDASAYPSSHPDHPGYRIFFSFKGGGEVTITTPEHPGVTSPLFWMLDLLPGEWTRLVDPDGRPIPVELRFESGLASASWL